MGSSRLDLRAGRSVWEERRRPPIPHAILTGDHKVDVAIVGAGISGAMVAQALVESGVSVILLDRRQPLRGSTAASTALLQYELDVPLSKLSQRMGLGDAERVWRRSRLVVDALRSTIDRLAIDADLEERDSLYLSGNVLDREGLLREQRARRRIGIETELLESSDLRRSHGIRGRAALRSFANLCADPVRLAAGFLRDAIARGAKLFAPEDVVAIDPTRRTVTLTTRSGHRIHAGHAVLATGYELWRGIPAAKHDIYSTWAIATRPQPSALWEDRCLLWEASDPYLYVRTTREGRVICGGEDETFEDEGIRNSLIVRKTRTLERKLGALFPALDVSAEYAWTGSFGASSTGTPSIGSIPGMPRCFGVLGYGGNGITFSMMAAQMIRNRLHGDADADAALFAIGR